MLSIVPQSESLFPPGKAQRRVGVTATVLSEHDAMEQTWLLCNWLSCMARLSSP